MSRVSETGDVANPSRVFRWALLAGMAALAAIATLPASASAAPCPGGTTSWMGGSGSFNEDSNWSNGGPSSSCDTVITNPGTYTVSMTGGASMKSFTFGNATGTQTLNISGVNPNTNLNATTSPSSIGANAAVVLTCPILSCNGGGGPSLNFLGTTLTNEGTITVDSASGGSTLSGGIVNTGTIQINGPATQNNGTLLNQGEINIADGKALVSAPSHCGDSTGAVVKNDTGGEINAAGNSALNVVNYEQGAGTTSGANPVQMPCGSLKYTGNGASTVLAYGGFILSGEMQSNQSLNVIAASSNTNASLTSDFVNKGSITLSCPGLPAGCNGGPGGGPGFNAAGKAFTNAGTFTVEAAAGTGTSVSSGLGGTLTNTGTMNFNQSASFGGIVVNKGPINIADGKTVTSSGSSCGDTGAQVKNDTGGQINAVGTGTFSVLNYEQGAGTTSGAAPVQMPCGSLKYTGTGAGTVQVNGGLNMTGDIGSGQTLRLLSGVNSPPLNNAGTIALTGGVLNTSSLTNTGRLAGIGIVTGSVNSSGAVAPGASPGTLTINGSYSQSAAGSLEIEVEGTGIGQFDKLAIGGNATLGGTLTLQPSGGYAASAAVGNNIAFLSYGGSRTNQFATTTTNPPLACPKQFTVTYDDGAKSASAVVSNSGASCSSGGGGGGGGGEVAKTTPVAPQIPVTVLKTRPRTTVKTKKAKAKVTFAFSSDVAGSTFQCKLDKGAFALCSSPKSYKVKPGKHKFTVKAIGPSGAADSTPVSFSFKVVKEKQ